MWHRGENPLDAGPCRWWGVGCRYLDVRNKRLLSTQTVEDIQPFHLGSPDLAGRRFRFARLDYAYLPGADLRQTELQGAKLVQTNLQGANLSSAKLYGAGLAGAELQGTNLTRAALQGTYLAWAKLQGANLSYAELHGADLTEAQLQGTNLAGAALQGSKIQPASWYLTWMPDADFDFSDSLADDIGNIKPAWKNSTLQEHMKRSLRERGTSREIFGGAKPEKKIWFSIP